ncbi:serine/threonine protein kinase [Roseiconus nitratireducens]|uniref:Serine/threonine protein kinase n=1 Tax=Roseiconus nitratireducens TaxID=2605748 RepID=A0A5M6CXC5_9BACT|nr:serine/threonine-protein kinase [Roseiconus nitratireducens]KAA5539878.1 serine/threonine protein kinase [Roseiconus nitratireducens]
MNLDQLSAAELAVIDAVCLDFEQRLRSGRRVSVESVITSFLESSSATDRGTLAEPLRQELIAVERELDSAEIQTEFQSQPVRTPFQPRTRPPGGDESGKPVPTARVGPETYSEAPAAASVSAAQGDRPSGRPASSGPAENGTAENGTTENRQASQGDSASNPGRPSPAPGTDPQAGPETVGGGTLPGIGGMQTAGDTIPDSVGPYLIVDVLARGGMGVVYRATDTRLDRPVAIKMLGFPHLAGSDPKRTELIDRFEREARAVAALSHPNIVELFDVGVQHAMPYAVMELLNGTTLAKRFAHGPLSAEQTRQVGMQIAGALATAHAAGVIHRDLKPQNIMVVDPGDSDDRDAIRVKLVDFGLSRVSDAVLPDAEVPAGETRSGTILGTPGYMAPEQVRGESAKDAADIFGLGCILHEAFYGTAALPGQTPADRLAVTLAGDVQSDLNRYREAPELGDLISHCLEKQAGKRPSATEVYRRLRQLSAVPAQESLLVNDGNWSRRHAMVALSGGVAGMLWGLWPRDNAAGRLGDIRTLAVLTPRNLNENATQDRSGLPLAGRRMSDGEAIAVALVNELSGVEGLAVRPFRPQMADSPDDFRRIGENLNVDALLTGAFEFQQHGALQYWVFNWQLVSAQRGNVLYGEQFVSELSGDQLGERLLTQTGVASKIARRIDRVLVSTAQSGRFPKPEAYGCMVKGWAQADIDSVVGLQRALDCFRHSYQVDSRLVEPLAAVAVTALLLAARSEDDTAKALLGEANQSFVDALQVDPDSMDAQLAQAMYEWQTLQHYQDARDLFGSLAMTHEYKWQIQHQFGLLLTALGVESAAIDMLRAASKMNPMSVLVRADRCRADWFFHYPERAIRDAKSYLSGATERDPANHLMTGLLIDIYEEQRQFGLAAELFGWEQSVNHPEEYFRRREETLVDIPYGPFGPTLNRAIFDLRAGDVVVEELPGRLDESGAPMFPLLLARHPAFAAVRESAAAERYLPDEESLAVVTPTRQNAYRRTTDS